MTDNDSLRDVVDDTGDGRLKDKIVQEFGSELKNEILWGEPLDVPDVHTAVRQYDHGQASDQTVTETGVKVVFDPDHVEISQLETGGEIRRKLHQLANQYLTPEVSYIDVMTATDDAYTVWIIIDTSRPV